MHGWYKNPRLEMDAVFRPGIDDPFSWWINDLEMGEGKSSANPIVLDEEKEKQNSPPITPLSERVTEPPRLLRSRSFVRQIKNVTESVYRTSFE